MSQNEWRKAITLRKLIGLKNSWSKYVNFSSFRVCFVSWLFSCLFRVLTWGSRLLVFVSIYTKHGTRNTKHETRNTFSCFVSDVDFAGCSHSFRISLSLSVNRHRCLLLLILSVRRIVSTRTNALIHTAKNIQLCIIRQTTRTRKEIISWSKRANHIQCLVVNGQHWLQIH